MGKAEGSVAREEWHGHVTALSVAPEFRRLGLAAKLMEMLEEISERSVPREQANDTVEHDSRFCSLFNMTLLFLTTSQPFC